MNELNKLFALLGVSSIDEAEKAVEDLQKQNAEHVTAKQHLRETVVKRLAEQYKIDPCGVAHTCDQILDRSGAMLGWVRVEARKSEQSPQTASAEG